MPVPNELNPNYDNYGKGSWNRARKNETEYRNKLSKIDYTCLFCGGSGLTEDLCGEEKPCPICKPHVTKIETKGVKTRITYGTSRKG